MNIETPILDCKDAYTGPDAIESLYSWKIEKYSRNLSSNRHEPRKMVTVERTSESIVRKVVLHPLRTFGSFNRYLGSRRLGSSIYPKFQMDSWKNIVRSSRSKKYTGHWIHYSHTFFLELILDNRSISLNTPRWYYILYVSTQFTNITSSSEINIFTISQDIEI